MDPSLTQFYHQYLQQLNDLCYPSPKLLLQPGTQEELFHYMFNDARVSTLPPLNYQRRVLKTIIEKAESAIDDPEEDEILDSLMTRMAFLSTVKQPPEAERVQERTIVYYHLPLSGNAGCHPAILIQEARNLLALGSNVGLRTWDSCLRLAYYLVAEGRSLIQDKTVIELGAGTGLLSILCARHLRAARVLATDGIPHVVTTIQQNFDLNSSSNSQTSDPDFAAKVLDWTDLSDLEETLKHKDALPDYDIVLGSDITYNLDHFGPLVETLDALVKMFPKIDIVIAGAVRNANTYNVFVKTCADMDFEVTEISFECPPFHQQKGFFHTIALPIKLMRIKRTKTKSLG